MFNISRRFFSFRSLLSSEKVNMFTADLPSTISKERSLVRNAHRYDAYFSIGLFQNVEVIEKAQFMNDLEVDELSIKETTKRCLENIYSSESSTVSFFKNQAIANIFGVDHEVHNENFLMDFFYFSTIAEKDCSLLSGNISARATMGSYDNWDVLNNTHFIGFRPDHYVIRTQYTDFNQDVEVLDMVNMDNRQWVCHRNVPIFCSDIKARSAERGYDDVLKGIGQVVLYNAYLINKLVTTPVTKGKEKITFPRTSIDSITMPGFLFKNPYLYLFETTFTAEWMIAFETGNYNALFGKDDKNKSVPKIDTHGFPKIKLFCSGNEENQQSTITGGLESIVNQQVYGYNILNNPREYFEGLNVFEKLVSKRFDDGCVDTLVSWLPVLKQLSDQDVKTLSDQAQEWKNLKRQLDQ